MKPLSFEFYLKYGRNILVITSIIANIVLFLFMVFYLLWGTNNKIQVFCFLTLYISTSNIFNYYLIKSKSIKYDSSYLYIENSNDNLEKIPIKNVIRIRRTYHYFYTIYYNSNETVEGKIIFFISPNPSFFKSKKVKEVLSYAKK